MTVFWGMVASPGASLLAGLSCLTLLWWSRTLRERDGSLHRPNITSAVMLTASFYTMLVLIVGEFFFSKPVSETIRLGFGDGRIAWLLVALAMDTGLRLIAVFDTPKPA
jgi:hypothetical protein